MIKLNVISPYRDTLVKDEIWKYNSKSGSHLCNTNYRSYDLHQYSENELDFYENRVHNIDVIGFGHVVSDLGYIVCPSQLMGFKSSCLMYEMKSKEYNYMGWDFKFEMPKWPSAVYVQMKR